MAKQTAPQPVPQTAPSAAIADNATARIPALTEIPSADEIKQHEQKGEKLYEVSLPKGFSAYFWAARASDAKDAYLTFFGIISTEHKLRCEVADPADLALPSAKKAARPADEE
jgi:hypothetical protein